MAACVLCAGMKKRQEISIERTLARTPVANPRLLKLERLFGRRISLLRLFDRRGSGVQWAHIPPVAA